MMAATLGDPPHDTSVETGAACWCQPEIQHTEGADVIIHRTFEDLARDDIARVRAIIFRPDTGPGPSHAWGVE